MLDFRPVGYVIGLLLLALGASMGFPALADWLAASGNWRAFVASGAITVFVGVSLALACRAERQAGLSVRQTFLLTVLAWVVSPVFCAVPLVLGEPGLSSADAFFESMSGLTTTGATVIVGLDAMPPGVLLWRTMLHFFGGLGIIVVALAFLPALRVGGMQLFKSEAFDTMGKILPRARDIALSLSWMYVALTVACAVAYAALGMSPFDAVCHAMSTIATGGFANYDSSFGAFGPGAEYAAAFFMFIASLPFVRLVQVAAGTARPLLRDPQVQGFFGVTALMVLAIVLWRLAETDIATEAVFRRALFNTISIITGTGFVSEDYSLWGSLPIMLLFIGGIIGGCTGSATCAIKVFRFQVLGAAIVSQVRLIHSPSGVFPAFYDGRRLDDEVLSSVMTYFYLFGLTLAVVTVALSMMGLDAVTAISGAATALTNVGPGFGTIIGPAGNFAPLPDAAKWVLSVTMLLGRLELVSVFVIFTVAFWRH
jgi:trk system potassium uptake protein TrkH